MGYEVPALIAGLVIGALLLYLILSQRVASMANAQARNIFDGWAVTEKNRIETEADQKHSQISKANFEAWKATELQQTIKQERQSAVDTQRVVIKGKIAEQMAPLFPEFRKRYNPADARFIGSPIDYIIFRNLSKIDSPEEAPLEIVLLDVKTGESSLNKAQKMVESAVNGQKRMSFYTLHLDTNTPQ